MIRCDGFDCDAIASSIAHPSLQTAQVNADQVPEVVALINDCQPDIVINVALPYQDLPIIAVFTLLPDS